MTKKVIERLKNYQLKVDESRKKEVLLLGISHLKSQKKRISYLELAFFTIRFISLKTWLIQFVVFGISLLVILNNPLGFVYTLIKNLTGLLIISLLFFMEELFKSFTSGMWELEQTFKYDLRQHVLVKLFIFGFIDFLIVLSFSILTNLLFGFSFFSMLLYLLVPYNIVCIVLFYSLSCWRNSGNHRSAWFVLGMALLILFVALNLFNPYRMAVIYWFLTYLISLLILALLFFKQVKKLTAGGMIDGTQS